MTDQIPLFTDAIKSGDSLAVIGMLQKDPSLSAITPIGAPSIILLALYHGQRETALKIGEHCGDVSAHEAAALGWLTMLKNILEPTPEAINDLDDVGFTPLHLACFFGQTDVAFWLIDAGAEVNKPASPDAGGVYALHSATAAGTFEIIAKLLSAGADPNLQQTGGYTALHSAAMHGRTDIITALLSAGAEPDRAADNGETAYDFAEKAEQKAAMSMLVKIKPR